MPLVTTMNILSLGGAEGDEEVDNTEVLGQVAMQYLLRQDLFYPYDLTLLRSELYYPYDPQESLMRSELFLPQDAPSHIQEFASDANRNEIVISSAVKVQAIWRKVSSRSAFLQAKAAAIKLISIGRIFLAKKHLLTLANARNTTNTCTDVVLFDPSSSSVVMSDLVRVWTQMTTFALRRALLLATDGKVFTNDIEKLILSYVPDSKQLSASQIDDSKGLVTRKKTRSFSLSELFAFASVIFSLLENDGRFEVTWLPWTATAKDKNNSIAPCDAISLTSSPSYLSPSRDSFQRFCEWFFGSVRNFEGFAECLWILGVSLSLKHSGASLVPYTQNRDTLLESIWQLLLNTTYKGSNDRGGVPFQESDDDGNENKENVPSSYQFQLSLHGEEAGTY